MHHIPVLVDGPAPLSLPAVGFFQEGGKLGILPRSKGTISHTRDALRLYGLQGKWLYAGVVFSWLRNLALSRKVSKNPSTLQNLPPSLYGWRHCVYIKHIKRKTSKSVPKSIGRPGMTGTGRSFGKLGMTDPKGPGKLRDKNSWETAEGIPVIKARDSCFPLAQFGHTGNADGPSGYVETAFVSPSLRGNTTRLLASSRKAASSSLVRTTPPP